MTDLLGNRIEMYVGVPSTTQPHIDAGKIRARDHGHAARRDAAQHSHRRRVGLSGFGPPTGTRSSPRGRRRRRYSTTGTARSESARRSAREGRARTPRARSGAGHARRSCSIHRPRDREVGQGRARGEGHDGVGRSVPARPARRRTRSISPTSQALRQRHARPADALPTWPPRLACFEGTTRALVLPNERMQPRRLLS